MAQARAQEHEAAPVKPNGSAKPSIFDEFVTDPKLEEDGVWRLIDGWRFKIRRANNQRHQSILSEIAEPTLRAYENGELVDEEQRRVLGRLVGEGMLADWDQRFEEPFSPETARKLIERAPHLGHKIAAVAASYEHYVRKQRERDSKN